MQLAAPNARFFVDPRSDFRDATVTALRAIFVFCLLAGCLFALLRSGTRDTAPVAARPTVKRSAPVAPFAALKSAPRADLLDDDTREDQAAATWARRIPDEEFRRQLAAIVAEQAPILGFGPVRIKRDLVEPVVRAARRTAFDPAVLMAIADKESSFLPSVKASTSSATGLFQFIDRTWLRVVRQFGGAHRLEREAAAIEGPDERPTIADARERERVLALRNDPYLSAVLAAEMLKADGGEVSRLLGRKLTAGETYLTHFLGTRDANRFMASYAGEPESAAAQLLKAPARANRPIFYGGKKSKALSVAKVHEKFEEMMGARVDRYSAVGSIAGVTAYAE